MKGNERKLRECQETLVRAIIEAQKQSEMFTQDFSRRSAV
jgi:hypothetical protein